jgi:hypothetical protein
MLQKQGHFEKINRTDKHISIIANEWKKTFGYRFFNHVSVRALTNV